jgi:alkylation response protein AidB-like acyl-CoA dehydrogenase
MIASADHDDLRQAVRQFVSNETRVADLRSLRDSQLGLDRDLWTTIAALGWPGIPFPDELGGQGSDLSMLGTVMTELGRTLTPTPFLSTVILAGQAILVGATASQQATIIPDVVHGRRLLAFAHQEGRVFSPYEIRTSGQSTDDGHVLRGTKHLVHDAHVAESLVVVARTSGTPGDRDGLTLLLVPTDAAGVLIVPGVLLDGRVAATVELVDVKVGHNQLLGAVDHGAEILDRVLTVGTALLAAEMLGGIEECFSRTVAYLRERHQFGVPIGSFQALQHRAADWTCEVELARAIVDEALESVDLGTSPDATALASAAKSRVTEVFMRSACEAIQMFGGVGMTDAHEIGFFLKRARVAEQTLGDSQYHRARFACLRRL